MNNIDKPCRSFCRAINSMTGLKTTSSCSGHGTDNYKIWFKARRLNNLIDLLYWLDGCHCGFYNWKIFASTDCAKNGVHFCIEGPIGEIGYSQSNKIAELILKEQAQQEAKP